MMSTSSFVFLFSLLAAPVAYAEYIENIAANLDGPSKKPAEAKRNHEPFIPMVAFHCDHRNKFMDKSGEWQDDPSGAATCLEGKYDILKYCKRVYPGQEITNIVEYSHMVHIDKWCREDGTHCNRHYTVRPYRCIVGEFVTESLQVPSKCHFSHIAGGHNCNDYAYWNMKAQTQCAEKVEDGQGMKLRSFSILEPCGLGMFRGVEYVCCPKAAEEKIEKVMDLEKDADEDDYDDDEEEEEPAKKGADDEKSGRDPYFNDLPEGELDAATEHERFREAEERLERKHRRKVTKVITEWSELFERYNKMKETDAKGAETYKREMTARFRKTVAALEAENKEQRTQIEEVHDERIQNILNEKKRKATHEYRAALAVQVGTSNKNNVLRTLKNYIKAEEKDRAHMLNRYRHLLRSDPEAAATFKPVLLHRLRYIDLRINGTLAMLRDFPLLEKQVRPQAIGFWKEYRRENTPEADDSSASDELDLLGGEEQNVRLLSIYEHSYERNHPGVAASVGGSKRKTLASTPTPMVIHQTIVGLKDVLKENVKGEEGELPEDSDEDQFEEDEDGEKHPSPKDSKKATDKEKIARNLLKAMKPWKVDLNGPAMTLSRNVNDDVNKEVAKPPRKTVLVDSNPDDDDDESGENGAEEGTRKKTLTVSIEPIVSASKVSRDGDAKESGEDSEVLLVDVEKYSAAVGPSSWSTWAGQTNMVMALMASALVLLVIGLLIRRRSRHPGFIEVEVCTPEERHVNGMQINGYENPTYAFFDAAKA